MNIRNKAYSCGYVLIIFWIRQLKRYSFFNRVVFKQDSPYSLQRHV